MATHSSVLAWRTRGQRSLVGYHLWGRTESDTTEATQQQQQQDTLEVTKLQKGKQISVCQELGCRLWGHTESNMTEAPQQQQQQEGNRVGENRRGYKRAM